MKINLKYLVILFIIFIISYFLINNLIGKNKLNIVKNLFNQDQINLIKKYIFPYKKISELEKKIDLNEKEISNFLFLKEETKSLLDYVNWIDLELRFKDSLKDIKTKEIPVIKIDDKLTLKKYKLLHGFYAGRASLFPGTGYIDFHYDNLLVLSARGVLGVSENINDKMVFKQIENNITDFFNLQHYKKNKWFGLKDLYINKNKIFISYDEEMTPDCWNKSIIWGDINYKKVKFEKLFSSKNCIHSKNNIDKEFRAFQTGGRIVNFDDNHILLSVGEYRSRYLAQEKDNINGKIIKINIDTSDYEIVSMGHRNPQGMYFDKKENFIIETEHGPLGGDEINLVEINRDYNSEIPNYGWAIASAGIHYGSKDGVPSKSYEKYPLYKSHKDHGFIEPLKNFNPAVGISEITKVRDNEYVASSLKEQSIYFFRLNEKKISSFKKIKIFERVRDITFKENKLYLFLENTASIGVIDLNNYNFK